jgi:hypothetical protein
VEYLVFNITMRILLFASICLAAVVFTSCQRQADSTASVSDTVVYIGEADNTFEVTAVGIISTQQLIIDIKPKSADAALDKSSLELTLVNESRAYPTHIATISTGESIQFEPVSSRFLYQQCGLRGDLDPQYTFSFTGTHKGKTINKKFLLNADAASFNNNIARFGIKGNVQPFKVSGLTSASAQENRLVSSDNGLTHEKLRLSDNEILCNGFWAKFGVYQKEDTVYANVRILNQTNAGVSVNGAFAKTFLGNDSSRVDILPARAEIRLNEGDRTELHWKISAKSIDKLILSLDRFRYPNNTRVIDRDIIFKPMAASDAH